MRILLVDDDRLQLTVLARFMGLQRPLWEVLTAQDGFSAMAVLGTQAVDVLVTDLLMPGIGGMALLAMVRQDPALAHLPLILMTAQTEPGAMRQGMSSGADDFLVKPFAPEELVLAVEARIRRLAMGPEADLETAALRERLAAILTARELDILARIGTGLVTKDIAADLDLSPRTVSVHRANIMRKLDLHNAAALAALAIRAGV